MSQDQLSYAQCAEHWKDLGKSTDRALAGFIYSGSPWGVNSSHSYWHQHDMPCIVISDEEPIYSHEDTLDGYLGIYQSRDLDWAREGRIVLFRKNIATTASKFITTPEGGEFSLDQATSALTNVVLIHELGHWIHHYLPLEGSGGSYCTWFGQESKHSAESIAQFITKQACTDHPLRMLLFEYLIDGRPSNDPYRGHEAIEAAGFISMESFPWLLDRYRSKTELNRKPLDELLKTPKLFNLIKLKALYGI